MRHVTLAAFVVATLGGCRAPTEITLEISTDIDCTALLGTSITAGTYPAVENLPAATSTTTCTNGKIGTIVVVPASSDSSAVDIRVIGGKGVSPDDCLAPNYKPMTTDPTAGCVVARRLIEFEPHDPLYLPIVLRSSCVGHACMPNETCVEGGCVSATVPDPTQCATPEKCGENVLVDGGAPDSGPHDAGPHDAGDGGPDDGGDGGPTDAGDAGDGGLTPTAPPRTVAAADNASCALGSDAQIYCWGENWPITNPAQDPVLTPTLVTFPSKITFSALSASQHVCAIASTTKALYCWGGFGNVGGTSGDGVTTPFPAAIANTGLVDEVVTPSQATCFRSGSVVKCFGDQGSGALGTGSNASGPKAMAEVPGMTDVLALGSGDNGVCAIRPSGSGTRVTCWSSDVLSPMDVPGIEDGVQAAISGGVVFVLRANHQIWSSQPMSGAWLAATPTTFADSQLLTGGTRVCAVRSQDGDVVCARSDLTGMAVIGGFKASDPVVELSSGTSNTEAGQDTECARTQSGAVWCWGSDRNGQVGISMPDAELVPSKLVPTLHGAVKMAVSDKGSAAVLGAGTVSAWGGADAFGSDYENDIFITQPTQLPSYSTVQSVNIATYDYFAYLMLSDGTVGLYDGSVEQGMRLQASTIGLPFINARNYSHFDIALAGTAGSANTVLAYYVEDASDPSVPATGLLGNGGALPTSSFGSVSLPNAMGIGYGTFHALAWTSAGDLYCWGANDSETCAQDPTANPVVLSPTKIAMTALSAGVTQACGTEDSSCAVTTNQEVYCWGDTSLGLGSAAGSVPELKATGMTGVACGQSNVCVWSATQVMCWGDNGYGQVGTGDRVSVSTPTPIALAGALDISLSNTHACAAAVDNTVYCWGSGFAGKLGNGQTGYYTTAQLVTTLP